MFKIKKAVMWVGFALAVYVVGAAIMNRLKTRVPYVAQILGA